MQGGKNLRCSHTFTLVKTLVPKMLGLLIISCKEEKKVFLLVDISLPKFSKENRNN
jgi:hypothetical protein